jgi:hypothetical protein
MGQIELDQNGNVVRPVVALLSSTNGTGSPVPFNSGGEMVVSSKNYLIGVAEGDIAGHSKFSKLGNAVTSGTAGNDIDIWYGNTAQNVPTAGQTLWIASSSAGDTLAGTGVQKVKVGFLDATFTEKSIEFSLQGTTPVSSTNETLVTPTMNGTNIVSTNTNASVFRITSIRVSQVNGSKAALGNIIVGNSAIVSSGGTNIFSGLNAGQTRGRNAFYTVPAGKALYITSMSAGLGYTGNVVTPKTSTVILRGTYDDANETVTTGTNITGTAFHMPYAEIQISNGFETREFELPIKFPAGADVKVSLVTGGETGTSVKTSLRGWVETV